MKSLEIISLKEHLSNWAEHQIMTAATQEIKDCCEFEYFMKLHYEVRIPWGDKPIMNMSFLLRKL